jgi:hypothetical protein
MGDFYYPAFCGCTALSIVTIGENVKSIPAYAFFGCTGLKNRQPTFPRKLAFVLSSDNIIKLK